MTKLRCAHCGSRFTPAPQVPKQTYCSKTACQKARRRQWQKNKLQSDPDYRDNQARAQKAWAIRNPDYWRLHRKCGSNYSIETESEHGSSKKQGNATTKMGASNTPSILRQALKDGVFRLKVLSEPDGNKMDVWC